MFQALLVIAAHRIGGDSSESKKLLLDWSHDQSVLVPRFIASCFLIADFKDESPETAKAFNESVVARGTIALEHTLEKCPAYSRSVVYKMLLSSPDQPYPECIGDDVFQLLKAVFNDAVSYGGYACSTTLSGEKLVDYRLEGPKSSLPNPLADDQSEALQIIVDNDVIWRKAYNFWSHFGLPNTREGLRTLL